MDGGTLQSLGAGGDDFSIENACYFLAGNNSTISGVEGPPNTALNLQMGLGREREIEGTLENLTISGDITGMGAVINCDFADSDANIRSFHHTIDTQQLLDADSAGDDDLKLPKPSLDNAMMINTGD